MAVLLIGTLDTKGTEVAYIRDQLLAAGVPVLVADVGVIGPPAFAPDISRESIFSAAGANYEQVKAAGDRGHAIARAAAGIAQVALRLYGEGKITGILSLGGSAGTTIGTAAMRALPVGVPKLMVSTLASGPVQHYVGTRDILMMYSVVDIAGINRISRSVFDNAAAAMAGMVQAKARRASVEVVDRPVIAATMFGVTTPCVETARGILEAAGYEVLVFHATGTGGRTMEGLIRDGLIAGVLDITTTELADELAGGILSAGPDRLTAAGLKGIPQVVSLGALDMVNFGPRDTVPDRYKHRRLYQHNPNVTLMRTTPQEMDRLGKEIAEKTSAARGPTCVMIPLLGVSALDAAGQPFWWPEANAALLQSLRNWLAPHVEVVELDYHINDPAFAQACANKLLALLQATPGLPRPG
ncbi:MAG: Tm-1-like ATP-binding domain-containing protein [Gemmataceae bacterium]|nr:Tm-1-like ATP-binding domain-containing protein [Gemmata sp.]MDW8197093.1 Tm-1-like ATP-binding domain-containing protein [Gemmataceae bacterium]